MARGAIRPPPTFQMDIFAPLSFTENQCTTTLPHGGHPMPWTPIDKQQRKHDDNRAGGKEKNL